MKKRRRIHVGRLLIVIGTFLLMCTGILYSVENYMSPEIYGKWESKETGKIVEFKKDGTVLLDGETKEATFKIISPNKMRYTIDFKIFDMHYELDGRNFRWGFTNDTVEIFKRK